MPVRRFSLILLLLLVGLALPHGPTRVAAQDPTPPVEGEVLGPADCTVEPVTADEMVALVLAAVDEAPPGASIPVTVDPALFAPVDPETAAAVAATVRQIIACINAG